LCRQLLRARLGAHTAAGQLELIHRVLWRSSAPFSGARDRDARRS
jgi:hypothetical protein